MGRAQASLGQRVPAAAAVWRPGRGPDGLREKRLSLGGCTRNEMGPEGDESSGRRGSPRWVQAWQAMRGGFQPAPSREAARQGPGFPETAGAMPGNPVPVPGAERAEA